MIRLYEHRAPVKTKTFGFRTAPETINRIKYVSGRLGATPSLYVNNALVNQLEEDEKMIKEAEKQKGKKK